MNAVLQTERILEKIKVVQLYKLGKSCDSKINSMKSANNCTKKS